MNRRLLGLVVMVLSVGLLAAACSGDAGANGAAGAKGDKGATGAQGPQGDPGVGPSEAELEDWMAMIEHAVDGEHASVDSIARGGRLYTKWWAETGADAPTADQPLWALQDTNARSGKDTWRCKECHGWDYKGDGGAYSSGSHYTGFPDLITAGSTLSKTELVAALQGSTDYRHDFRGVLAPDDIADLANFLSEGLVNDTLYFDYNAPGDPPINPDTANGEALYTATCVLCHGADGRTIIISADDDWGVGGVARGEPTQEISHIIRTGNPGTAMPSGLASGWSTQDAVDVLAYIMTIGNK